MVSICPQDEWIIDSGATHHFTRNNELLQDCINIYVSKREKCILPIGEKAEITHTWSANLFEKEAVHSVLYVPKFRFNLLSVSKVIEELSCFVTFFLDFCVFQGI